jgi:hypothetical protein
MVRLAFNFPAGLPIFLVELTHMESVARKMRGNGRLYGLFAFSLAADNLGCSVFIGGLYGHHFITRYR